LNAKEIGISVGVCFIPLPGNYKKFLKKEERGIIIWKINEDISRGHF